MQGIKFGEAILNEGVTVLETNKKYQVKTKPVTVMRTYSGQPLSEICDFMLGCKNIGFALNDVHEGFNEPIKGNGNPDLSPGDYIVVDEDGYGAFMNPEEFKSLYEVQVSVSELHYVIRTYGFPVEDAEYMLRDEKVRAILLAPLHEMTKKSSRGHTTNHMQINVQTEADVEKIAEKLNGILSQECIQRYL